MTSALKRKVFVIDTNVILHDATCIQNFKDNDVIIIQSCRPKEVELINFLSFFFVERPKIILRVLYPPKKSGFKNFYYFVDELKKKGFNVKIFAEVETIKKYIMERSDYDIKKFTQI